MRIYAPRIHVFLGAGEEKSAGLMHRVEPPKVFHGTNSMPGQSVLPTFMTPSARIPKDSQMSDPQFKSWTPLNRAKPQLRMGLMTVKQSKPDTSDFSAIPLTSVNRDMFTS